MKCKKRDVYFNVIESNLNKDFWIKSYDFWEESTFDFLQKFWNKDKTFIDIGSWIGPISLVASFYSKDCICFEPDIIAYDEFQKNIQENNINNIFLEKKAVSIHSTIEIGCETLGQSGTRDSCRQNPITCECISISEIFSKYSLLQDDVSVIKIDVEGHETELLQDKFLWDLNVPMHVSLHPGWKEDKEYFYKTIKPFFEYKEIDVSNIENYGNYFDIVIYKK